MAWRYEDQEILNTALNAVAGRPPAEYGMEPTCIEEIRRGCYDIADRVMDMNANGVLGIDVLSLVPAVLRPVVHGHRR